MDLDSSVVIHYGQPMDCFGFPVSADPAERLVEQTHRRGFLMDKNNVLQVDEQRDMMYTNRLARSLVQEYPKGTTVMSTHLATWAAWNLLCDRFRTDDAFRIVQRTRSARFPAFENASTNYTGSGDGRKTRVTPCSAIHTRRHFGGSARSLWSLSQNARLRCRRFRNLRRRPTLMLVLPKPPAMFKCRKETQMNVGILGGGKWGQALARLVKKAGHKPLIAYEDIRPPHVLPSSNNPPEVCQKCELILVATSAAKTRYALQKAKPAPIIGSFRPGH